MANSRSVVGNVRLGLKVFQLILACICMGLYVHSPNEPAHTTVENVFLPIVFGGYIILLAGVILGFILQDRVPRKIDLLWTITGIALYIAAGSVGISYFRHSKRTLWNLNTGLACGSISIINGAVMVLDAIFAYKDVSEYSPH